MTSDISGYVVKMANSLCSPLHGCVRTAKGAPCESESVVIDVGITGQNDDECHDKGADQ